MSRTPFPAYTEDQGSSRVKTKDDGQVGQLIVGLANCCDGRERDLAGYERQLPSGVTDANHPSISGDVIAVIGC
jgi:hypothetical protein